MPIFATRTMDVFHFLGCTNYKADKTGCNNYVTKDFYLQKYKGQN